MSIDKQGTGVPEFDLHRRTTKVNLATMVAVVLFFVLVGAVMFWFASGR